MPKLVPISAKEMIRLLTKIGFTVERQKGSHIFLRNDGKTTTIPVHSSEELDRSMMRKILRDIDMSLEEFERLRLEK